MINTLSLAQIQERIKEISATEKNIIDSMMEGRHFYLSAERKILSKGGAEYLAKIFSWRVEMSEPAFINLSANNDAAAQQVYFKAKVIDEKGSVIAESCGSRSLSFDGFLLNTSLQIARNSAFVDAVLCASGLSGYFDQDVANANEQKKEKEQKNIIQELASLDDDFILV